MANGETDYAANPVEAPRGSAHGRCCRAGEGRAQQSISSRSRANTSTCPAGATGVGVHQLSRLSLAEWCLHRLDAVLSGLGSGQQFPAILNDEIVGDAQKCFDDGRAMLKRIDPAGEVADGKGITGLLPGKTDGDDIIVFC